jgi:phosphoglycerate dehydrogenase-like enzyme
VTARSILVYHPDPGEAEAYARLIKQPRPLFNVHACAAPAAAELHIAHAEILYAWNFPRELLREAKRLRWVQNMGAGVERFLVPELRRQVALTRVAGIFGPWMAEYVLGWCLWYTQRTELFRAQQRERRWGHADPLRLFGATLCVVGLGDIGRTIARSARAFGMRVLGVTQSGKKVPEAERVYRVPDLKTAVAAAEFVALTVPLTETTRGLIGAAELAAMKPSAWLINVARGAIVDEAALLEALWANRLGGAVLDVFAEEPLPAGHPLWEFDNVVITPHISGPSTPGQITPLFNDNLRRYLARRPLRFLVDRKRGY